MKVVSFYAPRYEKWGADYPACLRILDASCKALGLDHVCITDAELPGDIPQWHADLPAELMTAILDGQRQYLASAGGPVLFVGADSVLTRDPFHMEPGCDLAVTIGPFMDCPMNTGFLLCNSPERCVPAWEAAAARKPQTWGDDQRFLFVAISEAAQAGLAVKWLRCEDHNWAPEGPNDQIAPTVVHFRGPRKTFMRAWWQNFKGATQ